MPVNYPPPVFSHQLAASTGAGAVIDIGNFNLPQYPPVIICTFTQGTTISYLIENSHDAINWVDVSGGGFSDEVEKDLIPGVRFWRTNIVSISGGSFTSAVGAGPNADGGWTAPNLYTLVNSTPANT